MHDTFSLLGEADKAIIARNFFLAEKLIKMALAEEPENSNAFLLFGKCFLVKGEFNNARTFLVRSLEKDPQNAYTFNLLARLGINEADYTAAYGWISKALEREPANAEYLGLKAIILLFGFENITEAKKMIADGLQKDPENIFCLAADFHAEMKMKNKAAAETVLKRAIRLYPDHPDLHVLLANLLVAEGNTREAYNSIMTSLRQIPGSDYYQCGLKNVLASESQVLSLLKRFIVSPVYKIILKVLFFIIAFTWGILFLGLIFQERLVVVPLVILVNTTMFFGGIPEIINVTTQVYLFLMKRKKVFMRLPHFLINCFSLIMWLTGAVFFLTGLLQLGEPGEELFLSLPIAFCALGILSERTKNDYISQKQKKYIYHDWISVFICFMFILSVIFYPIGGFELLAAMILFSLPLYRIRQSWIIDEKYDMSKTLTANE